MLKASHSNNNEYVTDRTGYGFNNKRAARRGAGFAASGPAGGMGQLCRRRGRLVRFSSLWHYRRAGVQPRIFPANQPGDGHPCRICHLRRRVSFSPAGRDYLWPLRRPSRAQADADDDRLDDGYRHRLHRPAPVVQPDRLVGAGAAGIPAGGSGLCRRRRMGRRGAALGGERSEGKKSLLQQRRAGGLRRRPAALHRAGIADQQPDHRRAVSQLGLALTLPVQRGAGPDCAVDP